MSREHFQPFSTIKLENDSFEGGIVPQNVATHVIFMGIYKGLDEFSTILSIERGPVGPVGLNGPKIENRAEPTSCNAVHQGMRTVGMATVGFA